MGKIKKKLPLAVSEIAKDSIKIQEEKIKNINPYSPSIKPIIKSSELNLVNNLKKILLTEFNDNPQKREIVYQEFAEKIKIFKAMTLNIHGEETYINSVNNLNTIMKNQKTREEGTTLSAERRRIYKAFNRWTNEKDLPLLLGFIEKNSHENRDMYLKDTSSISLARMKRSLKESFSLKAIGMNALKIAIATGAALVVINTDLTAIPEIGRTLLNVSLACGLGSAFYLAKQNTEIPQAMQEMENNNLKNKMPPSFLNKTMTGEESFEEVERTLRKISLYRKKDLNFASPAILRLYTDIYLSIEKDPNFQNYHNQPKEIGKLAYKVLEKSNDMFAEKLKQYRKEKNKNDNIAGALSLFLEVVGGIVVNGIVDKIKPLSKELINFLSIAKNSLISIPSLINTVVEKTTSEALDKTVDISINAIGKEKENTKNDFYVANINQVFSRLKEMSKENKKELKAKGKFNI